jgi:membrane protease YdiL (CAAX protease family)
LFGSFLALFFVWGGLSSLSKQLTGATEAHADAQQAAAGTETHAGRLLESASLMLLILAATLIFARVRGIPASAFGMAGENFSRAWLRAAIGLGMVLPPVWAANLAMQYILPQNPQEQDIVTMFRQAAGDGDVWAIRITCVSAVVIAPLVEETVFRGYFYPLVKVHAGAAAAALLTSAMFALSHGNLAVLPGLFLLSLALNLTYERFGSLWVSVGMHSVFNTVSLILIYLQSQGWISL